MVQSNNQAAKLFNLVLILSLPFSIISMAETRQLGIGFGKSESTPVCNSVYGAQEGDTCTTVAQKFNLTLNFFLEINPNINCDSFFVGQWLCKDGSVSH
ncbi:unnamed protein product [Ilex paraguariensis]|uniref:LysM domain-containing protein n=1 Tax=Ilex paraguariensis TaxID=185542 RepID=A0ABC8QS20_9AQUA